MTLADLPLFNPERPKEDWLVAKVGKTNLYRTKNNDEIVLSNGLIARTFRLAPNAATVGLDNLMTQEQMVRAVNPEVRLKLKDREELSVGGLTGQPNLAFLKPEWLDKMSAHPQALKFKAWTVGPITERFAWKRIRRTAPNVKWPPPGKHLTLSFEGAGLSVDVHYELYDGIPLLSKWFTLTNHNPNPIQIERFTSEVLGLVEAESVVDSNPSWKLPYITAVSDYAFGGMATSNANRTVNWVPDKAYATQVNYELGTPVDLEIRPPIGPDQIIEPGGRFESFRAFLLIHDSTERERQGLAVRKMYRTIAPWVTENPIMLHLTSTDPKVVMPAIDQAAECGFEMIVISFWSGLDMEDEKPENLAKFKQFRDAAKAKGVELGGYSLLASRSINAETNVVNPKPAFGNSPCLESQWGHDYFRKLTNFFESTGIDLLEHDGSYPGDTCASTTHVGHRGLEDSQWNQYRRITEFYQWCRARGIFLNVPDNYFLMGSNKTGMGYRESNWSLPREQQHIHARQNLFDGTWEKTPSMGWMMTPLVEYQGGGPAATIEPLREHLDDYQLHLLNNLGYGAQSCYRGPRIYDAPETKAMVQRWVNWFKQHRDILESDVVHIRRADGRRLDGVVHVNPSLKTPAMAVIYNPTAEPMEETLRIPLYYSGLRNSCTVAVGDSSGRNDKPTKHTLNGPHLDLKVKVPGKGMTWLTFGK